MPLCTRQVASWYDIYVASRPVPALRVDIYRYRYIYIYYVNGLSIMYDVVAHVHMPMFITDVNYFRSTIIYLWGRLLVSPIFEVLITDYEVAY